MIAWLPSVAYESLPFFGQAFVLFDHMQLLMDVFCKGYLGPRLSPFAMSERGIGNVL